MSECLLRHTLPIRSTSGRSWEQTTVSLRTASRCHLASFLLWLVGRIIPQKELMRRWLEPCWAAEMLPHTDPGPCLCMVAHVPLLHFWARPAEGAGGKQDLNEEVPYVPLSPRHCSQQHVEEVGLKKEDREHGASSKVPQRCCTPSAHYSSHGQWLPFSRAVRTAAGLGCRFGGSLLRRPKSPQELPRFLSCF